MFVHRAWVNVAHPQGFEAICCGAVECKQCGYPSRLPVLHTALPYIMDKVHIRESLCEWKEGVVRESATAASQLVLGDMPIASIHFQGASKGLVCPCLCSLLQQSVRSIVPCCGVV